MTIRTLYMDSDGAGALEYYGRDFRDLIAVLLDPGVIDLSSLKVIQRPTGANMTVTIGAGRAVIQSSYSADMGRYLATNTAAINDIAISAAPGTGTRRDIVGLQSRDQAAGGPAGQRVTVPLVVTGDTSGSDPVLPSSFLPLARVRVPAGTASITDALIDDLRVVAGRPAAPGTIDFSGSSWSMSGWLPCDGAAVSRTTYAALFAAIGTSYGAGNGTSTFNVPDLRGRFPVGAANMGSGAATGSGRVVTGSLGAAGGVKDAIIVSHSHAGPSHTHTVSGTAALAGSHDHDPSAGSSSGFLTTNSSSWYDAGGPAPTGSTRPWVFSILNGQWAKSAIVANGAHTHTVSGTAAAAGTGATGFTGTAATDANVPPFAAVFAWVRT
jgi:microcystin-dependent protein